MSHDRELPHATLVRIRRLGRWPARGLALATVLALWAGCPAPTSAVLGPDAAAVSPDGQRLYLGLIGDDRILVVDTSTNQVLSRLNVEPAIESTTYAAAISPDAAHAYFARSHDLDAWTGSGIVVVLDTTLNQVVARVPVGILPSAIALSPDGRRIYVANRFSSSISVIDSATYRVINTLLLDGGPRDLVVSPDGGRVYVLGTPGDPSDFSPRAGRVWTISVDSGRVIADVAVDPFPGDMAISPDGQRLYVTDNGAITVIDTAANAVAATVKGAAEPGHIAISPDGQRLYVDDARLGFLTVDTGSNEIIDRLATDMPPDAMALSPDGTRAYLGGANRSFLVVIDTAANRQIATVDLGLSE